MNSRFVFGLILLVAALLLAGCGSPIPGAGSPAGRIMARTGDTAAIVRQKMGEPDSQKDLAGGQSVWIYENYYERPVGPQASGWSEALVPGLVGQQGGAMEKPVTREVYHPAGNEAVRVTFKEGVVRAVESVVLP